MSAPQLSDIDGSGNIVVQAQGDGVTINVNQSHLSLIPWHRWRRRPEKLLDLLNPFMRAIPLIGREAARADLEEWLLSDRTVSVRCLVGSGGSGKTRLGIELCELADEKSWFAGFVADKELTRFGAQQNLAAWGWSKHTLVVVDYAASRARILRDWLVELARSSGGSDKRLRLLLLERHGDTGVGWWKELITPGTFSEEPLVAIFDPSAPVYLPSIIGFEERHCILVHAMAEASRLVAKAEVLRPPPKGENTDFDRRLADSSFASAPLYLTMAGITAVKEGIPTLLTYRGEEMAERLASDELSRIGKLAADRQLPSELLKYLTAGVTLTGGYSQNEFSECIEAERRALGYGEQSDLILAAATRDALGMQFEKLSPILPDLVGEASLLRQITTLSSKKQAEFVKRWFKRLPVPTAATLIRTAQDYQQREPVQWLSEIANECEDTQTLIEISSLLAGPSLQLAKFSVVVSQAVVTRLSGDAGEDIPVKQKESLALALTRMAKHLREVGRCDDSLAPAQRSVDICRGLTAIDRETFQPLLAFSLHELVLCLRDLGMVEGAFTGAQEACDILQIVVAKRSAFLPTLALTLNTLASRAVDLGRLEKALDSARLSVEIYRQLNKNKADISKACLAMSIGTLSNVLSDLGRREEALALARESMNIRRELAAAKPDAYLPELAISLNNLANRLKDMGQLEEAAGFALSALEIRRGLATEYPEVFLQFVAGSLLNLASMLSGLGRFDEALGHAEESVTLCRRLTAEEGTVHAPRLAMALHVFAVALNGLGRNEEALTTAQESLSKYREMNSVRRGACRLNLAQSLKLVSDCYASLAMFESAVLADEEALEILAPIFESMLPARDWMSLIFQNYACHLENAKLQPRRDMVALVGRFSKIVTPQNRT
jgi:tetratricopeptide (TPR) repeat protein